MITPLRSRRPVRRLAIAFVAVLGVSLLRSAAPAPEPASGVSDPVTGERIGELTYGISPVRLLDTRSTGKLGKDQAPYVLKVRGREGIPDSATGVFVNLTVSGANGRGYLAAWPEGSWPGNSNVNFAANTDVANFAFVAIGSDGNIRLWVAETDAHVIVDAVAFTSDLPTI